MAIYDVAPGLKQGALAHVSQRWPVEDVDVVLLMADEIEKIPCTVPVFTFSIADDPHGMPDDEFWRLYATVRLFAPWRVLTVCHMGENRSGLASVMILVARGMPVKDAIATVRRAGPAISVGQPHLFWNPGFAAQVERLLASA